MKSFSKRLDQSQLDYNEILAREKLFDTEQSLVTQYENTYESICHGDLDAVGTEPKLTSEGWQERLARALAETHGESVDVKMLKDARKSASHKTIMNRRLGKHRKKLYELEHPAIRRQRKEENSIIWQSANKLGKRLTILNRTHNPYSQRVCESGLFISWENGFRGDQFIFSLFVSDETGYR